MSDFWVFAYGSLMWRPGFEPLETVTAHLSGARRSLCVWSWVHRGTREHPGLVLGLDRGGSCRGVAYRVADEKRDEVIAYLRERELVTDVYREVRRPIRLDIAERPTVVALTYVVDRGHRQYAGRLAPEAILRHVRDSRAVPAPTPTTWSTPCAIFGASGFAIRSSKRWRRRCSPAEFRYAGVGREKG